MGLSAPKGEWAGAGGNMKPETIRLLLVAGKDAPLPVLPMEGEEGDQPAFDAARDNVSKVQALLEESFHCVTRAYTMAEALAAIAKQPFDLFLIDHEPASGESACPLLTAIMSDNSMSHIPSIVMSREDNQSCVAQCLHLGAVDYLVKPLRRNELNNLWAHVWRRRMSKTLTAPSQPERMPHTRANFGIENPQHNNSSGSDEERQGTGDDEEAGSAGSNCGQDVSNATGGSSGKKSATDKAAAQTMQTAQTTDVLAAPQSEGGTIHAVVSGTKRPLTSKHKTTSAFKAYSKDASACPKRSKSTGDEAPRMSLPHLHGGLQPGVSRQHSNTYSGPQAHRALQMQQEMARAANATRHMPLPPEYSLPSEHSLPPGMPGLEAYHAACLMAGHHQSVPMLANSNNGAESPYPADAALMIQHMLNQQRSEAPRSHAPPYVPPQVLHQASQFCAAATGVPPPELLRTTSSVSQLSAGCGPVADAHSLSRPSQVVPDRTTPHTQAKSESAPSPAPHHHMGAMPMTGLEQAAMALPPPSAYLQGHRPAHAAAVHLAGMLPFSPHMFHQRLLADPALQSMVMQDSASVAALQQLHALYAGMPPQMLEALAAGAPGMHAMLAPGAPRAMPFPSPAYSELMRAQYGTSTASPTPSPTRCASEGSGAQMNTRRGLATGMSRLAAGAVESAVGIQPTHVSLHSEASALERSETPVPEAVSAQASCKVQMQEKNQFRSFEKKIHYESRKQLAEKRPRVQGKFRKATSAPPTTAEAAAAAVVAAAASPSGGAGQPESGSGGSGGADSPVDDGLLKLKSAKSAQASLLIMQGTANNDDVQIAQKPGQRHVGGSEETSSGGSGSGGSGGMGQQGSSRGIHSGGSGSSRGEPSPPKPSQSA